MLTWTTIAICWGVVSVTMAILWVFLSRIGRYSYVDAAWAFGLAALGGTYALLGEGLYERRLILALLTATWGLRLAWHLFRRISSLGEDGRYLQLARDWHPHTKSKYFGFFQLQAIWTLLFSLPFFAVANNASPHLMWHDYLAVLIWILAMVGETIADRQLSVFKSKPQNRGQVCRDGLWAWSRHPNYFFEWLHWWSYLLLAWGSASFLIALAGPFVMLFFLMKWTGVPYTEAQALLSKGDSYRRYQNEVNAFFPWPPRQRGS